MPVEILLSTAYLPPVEYFSLIKNAERILIEKEENYRKQTYRNRCRILSSNGVLALSVPVMKGSVLKAPVKDITIDYSKRWQQVHLRAIASSYGTSPFFQFYFENIGSVINKGHKYLLDLNSELLMECMNLLRLEKMISFTDKFLPPDNCLNDFRYKISPKAGHPVHPEGYLQVFAENGFVPGLSIIDLLFNEGPDSLRFL